MRVYQQPPKDVYCPQWRKAMHRVCPTCVNWVAVDGSNPNTGEAMRGFQCALVMQFLATLELSQQVRQMDAKQTVEAIATRDAVCTRLDRSNMLAVQQPAQLLIEARHENHDHR